MKPWIAAIVSLVGALACTGEAPAQAPAQAPPQAAPAQQTPKRVWTENFDYRVEIDGAVSLKARLFSASGRASMMLIAPELSGPAVLQVASREVMKVGRSAIENAPVPSQVLLADSDIQGPPAPYTMDGDAVVFFQDGRKVRLGRKPPLIGAATVEEILGQLPGYRKGMEEYSPADSDTVYLKTYKYPVRIEVYFGSWCPHCRETVPRFLKSVSVASNANIRVSLVGVPLPPFSEYPPAKEKAVKGVPTFIVFSEDKEIGRVSMVPDDSSVEHELVKILFAHEQAKG